ncbi:MAG TPA: rRNA maturation RNase YbeY [Mycobacteriales bacterium]|nr:rRNA maturation RNase YbeY [Mycobacteriales bacterium]
MSVFVANESGVPIDEKVLVALARHALDSMGVSPLAELSVLAVDEGAMTALHEQYMGLPGPTDVLAFPQDDVIAKGVPEDVEDQPEALLGDVVLCPAYAARSAQQQGHSLEVELDVLLVHGILHLLGYDHAEPDEEREMFDRQRELLQSWGAARARG